LYYSHEHATVLVLLFASRQRADSRRFTKIDDVKIHWQISTEVGNHNAEATFSAQAEGEEITGVHDVRLHFTVTDTDECSLPPTHYWAHQCHITAQCVNTGKILLHFAVCTHI
jgi:hypothetical protein